MSLTLVRLRSKIVKSHSYNLLTSTLLTFPSYETDTGLRTWATNEILKISSKHKYLSWLPNFLRNKFVKCSCRNNKFTRQDDEITNVIKRNSVISLMALWHVKHFTIPCHGRVVLRNVHFYFYSSVHNLWITSYAFSACWVATRSLLPKFQKKSHWFQRLCFR